MYENTEDIVCLHSGLTLFTGQQEGHSASKKVHSNKTQEFTFGDQPNPE